MTERLHLSSRHREEIEALLRKHLPDVEVWAYGSRVNGRSHEGSDLDLVLRGPGLAKIDASSLATFTEALRDTAIPFLVEARDWARLPQSFHREIEREHVLLVEREGPSPRTSRCLGMVDDDTRAFGDLFAEPTRNGLTRPKAVRGSGVKMVNMGELFAHTRICNVPMDRVPLSRSEAERFLLEDGDLLFARQSLVLEGAGKCAIFLRDDEPVTFESHVTRVRLDQTKAHPGYYFYYLQSHHGRSAIRSIVEQGAGASGIRGSDLVTLDVRWRPLPEQHAIAHILGTLDDKIELNRRMNETLEAMARALFKSWFVAFDPVRAKMEGRDTGLPQEIADLFPDRLVASEMGEIPEGWRRWELTDLAVHHRATVSPISEPEQLFEHYSIPAYDGGQVPAIDQGDNIKSNKTIVPSNSVLLSKLNPVFSRVWLPSVSSGKPQICSTELLAFTPQYPANRSLLFCLFIDETFRSLLETMVTGTSKSHQRVSPKALKRSDVLCGMPELFDKFGVLVAPMTTQMVENRAESHTLAALRDLLLPKLMSGEILVPDTEKAVEPVT